ncbi:GlsB/YeaQ/YmgE family stress response membrane protein [Candidatus Saccharibacteria bacterium]|nr:GlsB/YeaQ/YmgE family stress response membrane protein [Candidatus Saccharibacteria bacterium]
MGILATIILGGIAGWIASMIAKTNESQGIIGNIIAGVLGAVVGGAVFNFFGGTPVTGFNLYSLMVATVGAVIVIAIYKAIFKK